MTLHADIHHTAHFLDKGSLSGAVAVSLADGEWQRVTIGGATTLSFTNWPAIGRVGELLLELVNAGSNVTWPTINWVKNDGSFTTTFSSSGATLQGSGTDFVLLWSRDGGSTVYGKVVR